MAAAAGTAGAAGIKQLYQTEVESWRELQSQNIEFTMKRLREPDLYGVPKATECYRSPAKRKRLLRWLATSAEVRDAQKVGFDLISSCLGEQRQDTVGDVDSNDL